MNKLKRALPLIVLLLSLAVVGSLYRKNAETAGTRAGYDYDALARTVVMDDGRAKPLDAVARNALLAIYGKQRFKHEGEPVDAIVWMMDVLARPRVAEDYKVFRIDHADVIELAGLRPSDGADGKFFSYAQLLPARADIVEQAVRLRDKEAKSVYDRAIEKLAEQLSLYEAFSNTRRPLVLPSDPDDPASSWRAFDPSGPSGVGSVVESELGSFFDVISVSRARGLGPREIEPFFSQLIDSGQMPQSYYQPALLYSAYAAGPEVWDGVIDRVAQTSEAPEQMRAVYQELGNTLADFEADPSLWNLLDRIEREPADPASAVWMRVVTAYRSGEPTAFNEALAQRRALITEHRVESAGKAGFEVFFNRFMPFVQAQALDVLGFLLAMIVLYFGKSAAGTWGRAVWLGMMAALLAAFAVHTVGIGSRMYIHGRPPVTDLYSSAVLVGWASAGVCLLIEWLTRRGIGGVIAAVCGFTTLIIAHHLHLEQGADTMGPMRAVLDSNFWLATHVIVVTLGYAATFVAGLMALVYIVMGMATPKLDRAAARQLTQMVYGTVCFALLLSFVGTVLGGIWADQSWGRFWGWDPKENGAVMIVIMNALILHAKWGKLVKERGLMVLAVGGNIITAWSWFGTNQLGVGLHAYGFTNAAVRWLSIFVASQLIVMAVAMIVPTSYWLSFRKGGGRRKQPSEPGGKPAPAGA